MTNFYFCDKLLSVNKFAGVTQWQSSSFPSWLRGFDSLHPLHFGRVYPCFYFGLGNPLFEIGRLFAASLKFSLSHRKSPALLRPLGALGSFPFTRSTLAGFIPAFILGLGILCSKYLISLQVAAKITRIVIFRLAAYKRKNKRKRRMFRTLAKLGQSAVNGRLRLFFTLLKVTFLVHRKAIKAPF